MDLIQKQNSECNRLLPKVNWAFILWDFCEKHPMNASAKNAQLTAATVNDPRWTSVVARDPKVDGKFYYSVKTTGVYCHPSCAARLARPENVRFHNTREEAERAGFRPCNRCKPNQPSLAEQSAARVTKACRIIEEAETAPSLKYLAAQVGVSAHHFHRIFKRLTGLTPKKYATAHREKRIRHELGRSGTVTEAIFAAGYNSSGRFYEKSNKILGMAPTHYRTGGANTEIRFAIGECSLGAILVAQSDRGGICAILLDDDPEKLVHDLEDQFPRAKLIGGDAQFEQLIAKVVGFVEAPSTGLNLPLDVRGTVFQQRVWQALCEIPVGSTASYTDIAKRIGAPKSARAVARSCAANTLAVAIPCHRVVRSDGNLSGYRWGVERKRTLLKKEANDL